MREEERATTQETIASNIRSIIKQKGLIQRKVAERAGFTEQQFCDMLVGRKIIRAEFAPAIAMALGTELADVLADCQTKDVQGSA